MKNGQLPDLVNNCMHVLKNLGAVYQRGGEIVRVANGKIYPLEEPWIQNRLEQIITFQKLDMRSKKPKAKTANCPPEIPKRILASVGEWPFDELKGIIHLPIMRKDGSIFRYSGYDPDTQLILHNTADDSNLGCHSKAPPILIRSNKLWNVYGSHSDYFHIKVPMMSAYCLQLFLRL